MVLFKNTASSPSIKHHIHGKPNGTAQQQETRRKATDQTIQLSKLEELTTTTSATIGTGKCCSGNVMSGNGNVINTLCGTYNNNNKINNKSLMIFVS
jgi:hypothetical protein